MTVLTPSVNVTETLNFFMSNVKLTYKARRAAVRCSALLGISHEY